MTDNQETTMSDRALATVESPHQLAPVHAVPMWTSAREQLIRDNFVPRNAPADMIEAFLALARHRGLAPEEKHVYLIERGGKWTIQTGIDGFRLIADRTGTYAGSDPAVYTYAPDGSIESATVTVWKMVHGQRCPFGATAFVSDYSTKRNLWASMPRVMIAKVAESAALRKAFPAQLAGIYESSEMDQAEASAPAPSVHPDRAPRMMRAAEPIQPAAPSRPATPQRLTASTTPREATAPHVGEQVADSWSDFWKHARALGFKDRLALADAIGDLGNDGPDILMQRLREHIDGAVEQEVRREVGVADVLEVDPATGEVIPPWVGQIAAADQAVRESDGLPGMASTRRGRTSDQVAGIN